MSREDTPPESRRVNTSAEQAIKALLTDRPIAYHPILARAVGSVTAGVLLAQLLYWTPRSLDPLKRVWKTQDEIFEETALTRSEQETARRILKTIGVVEEKRAGVPARMYFRVDMDRLTEIVGDLPDDQGKRRRKPAPEGGGSDDAEPANKDAPIPHSSLQDSRKLKWRDPADKPVPTLQAITETTAEITTENDVVVGALRDRGISAPVAAQLAQYPADYVLAKCEQVDWLVETKSRAVGKNAAGYLRRAIEEDYAPPPHYRSRAEREAEAADRAAAQADEAARLRELEAEEARAHELDLAELQRRYPPQPIPDTTLTTTDVWQATLTQLQQTLSGPNFEMFVKPTLLLHCDGETATIGARTAFDVEQLSSRLDRYVTPALSAIVGYPLHCTYVSLVTLLDEDPPPGAITAEPSARHRVPQPRSAPTGGRA
jgi:hypothetical protein